MQEGGSKVRAATGSVIEDVNRPAVEEPLASPTAFRLAGLSVLVGGLAVGYAASRSRSAAIVPVLTAGVAVAAAVPVAIASRRPPISPRDAELALRGAERPPTFTVLVGARDEAGVLGQLVHDVARQDYRDERGEPWFELVVVDDRSIDGSGSLVREAAAREGIASVTRVIRRTGDGLPDGKGAALTAAQPDLCRGDVVAVLDADARIDPGFLRTAAGYFAAGAPAVTARRRIMNAELSPLSGAQADEQTLDGELNRGRWALGGCSEFRGNGIMIRRDLLARVGGWRAAALCEDVDLSSRLAAATGRRVAWAIDAEVWEEPVEEVHRLWRQRIRWAEGALRRVIEHGPRVMRSPRLPARAKLDFATYAGQLAVPAIGLGAAAGAIGGRKRAVLSLLAGYLGISAALGWDSLRWEKDADGKPLGEAERARRALRVSVFNGIWLLALPAALLNLIARGGEVRYEKMPHQGGAAVAWGDRTDS